MDNFQKSIFKLDPFSLEDLNSISMQDDLGDVMQYPNLQEHNYLVDDVQNIMSKKVGDVFNVSDYTCKLVPFIADEQPIYLDNNVINIMWREDFTVHYYWVVILLMLYKIKCCQNEVEKISYKELLNEFNDYEYTYFFDFIADIKFIMIAHKGYLNKTSFIDILLILALHNIYRLEPDDIESVVRRIRRDRCSIGKPLLKDADKRLVLEREKLRQQFSKFYVRPI